MPSTYLADAQSLLTGSEQLLGHLAANDADVIVAEIADGVCQTETRLLLQSTLLQSAVNGVFFAAADALGACAGYNWLRDQQLPVLGISGSLTLSPLAITGRSAVHSP